MDWLSTTPVLMVCLFCFGVLVGGQINRGIYRLAWYARAIGPWSKRHEEAPPRHWFDRVPIFGWLGLSREAGIHGRGYWVRPLLIELAVGIGFAALYWYEVQQVGVYTIAGVIIAPGADRKVRIEDGGSSAGRTLYGSGIRAAIHHDLVVMATGFEHPAQIPSQLHQQRCSLEAPWSVANEGENNADPQGLVHVRWPERRSCQNRECEVANFVE